MKGKTIGNDYFTMSAYPQSTPVYLATTREHIAEELLEAGVVIKPAFCGPSNVFLCPISDNLTKYTVF